MMFKHKTPARLMLNLALIWNIGLISSTAFAAGDSELIAMPTGRLEPDGTWRTSYSFAKPYPTISTQATILPWLQGGLGIVRMIGVQGFQSTIGYDNNDPKYADFSKNYGSNKDKTFFAKVKITDETDTRPAIALMIQDPVGTSLFKSTAIAASKRFAVGNVPIDATIGYGTGRIKGMFGGVKIGIPQYAGLNLLLEKDANQYQKDNYSDLTGLNKVHQPFTYGLEYKPKDAGWGIRLAQKMENTEIQVQYEIDSNLRDAVPKTNEYERFRIPLPRPTESQWFDNSAHSDAMKTVLHSYGFKAIQIDYTAQHELALTLAHERHLYASAAVGDVIHIALKTAPVETRNIVIHYLNADTLLPSIDYAFMDLKVLSDYLTGQTVQDKVIPTVLINNPYPIAIPINTINKFNKNNKNNNLNNLNNLKTTYSLNTINKVKYDLNAIEAIAHRNDAEQASLRLKISETLTHAYKTREHDNKELSNNLNTLNALKPLGGYTLSELELKPREEHSRWERSKLALFWNSGGERNHRFSIAPKLGTYLNGPGGIQYALQVQAEGHTRLNQNTTASALISQNLTENVSKLGIAFSNSTQPHVRSEGALYDIGKKPKLDLAVINHVKHLGQGWYGRLNAGIFERMYAGVGAQLLYAPNDVPWALDVSVDGVVQRHPTDMFGLNDYKTATILTSLHYRLPMEANLTLRAGRFLAKDLGVRMEFTRRFWGGIELGAWLSVTNAKDYGVGKSNYRDKGLIMNIPFDGLMPNHSREVAKIVLAPWSRDVAQRVNNPLDLYENLAEDIRTKQVQQGMERLTGVSDYDGRVKMGALSFDQPLMNVAQQGLKDLKEGFKEANTMQLLTTGLVFTGVTALSDKSVNHVVKRIQTNNPSMAYRFKQLDDITTGLGVLGVGTSLLWAYDGSNWTRSRVALSSLEAATTAVMVATGFKYIAARARPDAEQGAFQFGSHNRANSSLPSRHVAMATALVTPYAIQYEAPILYVLPTLTALARVGTHKHWFSDTAAGAALGYVLGHIFHKAGYAKDMQQRSPVLFNATKNSLTVIIPTP